ncbi:MAG: hypothetical protein M9913_21235 [Bryobacteraceae bacterium]|nr:hypothetical protein [Solibacteraceae bacterium]MCO5353374.1 hypothetical protein [Bryobacteraceae bacterium]
MDRGLFLELARRGLRFPIATDLTLHEQAEPETARRDATLLGRVIAESAKRWSCPLGMPLMDLRLEKADLAGRLGVPAEAAEGFHFTERPPETLPERPFPEVQAAAIGAIRWVRAHTALVPCGITIGPFSLLTRLLADPITPLALLARGGDGREDPGIEVALRARKLAMETVERSVAAQLEAGARVMIVCEPSASTAYLSPRQMRAGGGLFEEFVLAPNRRLRDLIRAAGALLFFHNCGDLTDAMVAAFGADLHPEVLSLGSSRDLAADAALAPGDVVLYGNLPTRRFFSDSAMPVEEVVRLTVDLVARMRATGHAHIPGSECDVLHVEGAAETIGVKLAAFMKAEPTA